MVLALRTTWALFLGMALLMLANGMQGTLLGVRAGLEGFPTAVTGLVMSGYFMGFLAGSALAPRLVRQVGHIRVFAALASLISIAALIYALQVDPVTWFAMRMVTGFASAGVYVVTESWLNDRADNRTRGQLLALYMIVTLVAMGAGQFLLNLADPAGATLFIVGSILVSLSLIPLLLSATPAPDFSAPKPLGIRALYRLTPLGVVASLGVGVSLGVLWGLAAVYAEAVGLPISRITLYVGALFAGAILLQWPLGSLSDRYDRRLILTLVTLCAAGAAGLAWIFPDRGFWVSAGFMAVIGGLCMPSYSLCVAYANDRLSPDQMVAASASLYFVFGIGSSLGPIAAGGLMSLIGPGGFHLMLMLVNGLIGLFAVYRMSRRPAQALDEQTPSVMVGAQGSAVVTGLATEAACDEMAAESESSGSGRPQQSSV